VKKLAIFVLIITISLILIGCSEEAVTLESMTPNMVYHSGNGYAITLGMTKTAVDKLLGSPTRDEDNYFYRYTDDLTATYRGNVLESLSFSASSPWLVKGGLGHGSTLDEILAEYGELEATETDSGSRLISYYFTKDHKSVNAGSEWEYGLSFFLDDNNEAVYVLINMKF